MACVTLTSSPRQVAAWRAGDEGVSEVAAEAEEEEEDHRVPP